MRQSRKSCCQSTMPRKALMAKESWKGNHQQVAKHWPNAIGLGSASASATGESNGCFLPSPPFIGRQCQCIRLLQCLKRKSKALAMMTGKGEEEENPAEEKSAHLITKMFLRVSGVLKYSEALCWHFKPSLANISNFGEGKNKLQLP